MARPAPDPKRRRAFRRGHAAEYLAAAYLLCKGYRILAIRHRTSLGEIDLIARKPDAHRLSVRYDIVAVRPWRLPHHLVDAF